MKIGKNIRTIRESQGLSRLQLSYLCKISPDYIGRVENGQATNMGINNLQKLAEALGVDLIDLLKEPKAA